jgi:hypothetical protein
MDHDPLELDLSPTLTPAQLAAGVVLLSPLHTRALRAVDPSSIHTVARIAKLAGYAEDLAASALKRPRVRTLIEDHGCRTIGWLSTHRGELFPEHQP